MRKTLALIIFAFFSLACLGGGALTFNAPEGSGAEDISLFKGGEQITIQDSDHSKLIEDLFGRDYLFYESTTQIAHTDQVATDVQAEIEESLLKDDWRMRMDWSRFGNSQMSQWQKGDLQLLIFTIDNLNSDEIRRLNLSYGLQGINPGDTLSVAYAYDASQPLPDLTSTAEMASIIGTGTAVAISEMTTRTAAAYDAQMTGTAEVSAYQNTQTAIANEEQAAALSAEKTQSAITTQTAVSAAQTAAVTPTATVDPHPTLALPFEDDFNEGLKPEWRVLGSVQPVLVDGKLSPPKDDEISLEIGNGQLQNYTLEFDIAGSSIWGTGSVTIYFSANRALEINSSKLIWYEFEENVWKSTSDHNTRINWGLNKFLFRLRITREGNYYELYKDGALEHTMRYGDSSGSPIIIKIRSDNISIDNLIIKE